MEIVKDVGLKVKLVKGDITKYRADAIVNAANKYLEHGGGVALAIAKACAGDPQEYTEISKRAMREQLGKNIMDHGEVVVTPALNLERNGVKFVIHTVGPICRGKWDDELREKLFKAFIAPMKKADELKLKSIAFPAVSAGIYGCPLEKVVETFLDAVKEFAKDAESVEEVALVLFSEDQVERALKVFEQE